MTGLGKRCCMRWWSLEISETSSVGPSVGRSCGRRVGRPEGPPTPIMSVPPSKKHKGAHPNPLAPMTSAQLLECKSLLDNVLIEKDAKSVRAQLIPPSLPPSSASGRELAIR